MARTIIKTDAAPQAIGTYSQAVRDGDTVYMSGQIPLVPATMEVVEGDAATQVQAGVREPQSGGRGSRRLAGRCRRLTVYLTDLNHFPLVNQVMAEYFDELIRRAPRSAWPPCPRACPWRSMRY